MPNRILLLAVIAALLASAAPATAQDLPLSVTGTIDDGTPFVEVPFTIEQPNSILTADMRPTSGDLDTLLYLVDEDGVVIAENDDRAEDDYSSRLLFSVDEPGAYTIVATRYKVRDGKTSGDFELAVDAAAPEDFALPPYDATSDDLAAAGYPATEPRPAADWTILAYYGADTNLEAAILNDFNEFELAGGSNANVRIVVLLDRSPGYTDASGNWVTARLFEAGVDTSGDQATVYPPTIDSTPLADLGEIDMGDGQNLARFLVWGVLNYPAQHYAITFGSHGAGWQGLIFDESQDPAGILSIPELKQAFEAALAAAGISQFDMLINDACRMSSVEYLEAIAGYFIYAIASPELVIDPALDMTLLTQQLNASPSATDLVGAGIDLVDAYIVRDVVSKGTPDSGYYTSALTDLEALIPIGEALNEFATIVNAAPWAYSPLINEARAKAYTYSAFMGQDTLIDLGDFLEEILALTPDADNACLTYAAQDILDILEQALIYGNAGEKAAPYIYYYNIYFPTTYDAIHRSYYDESPLQAWYMMLQSYYTAGEPQSWEAGELVPRLDLTPDTISGLDLERECSLDPDALNFRPGDGILYGKLTVDLMCDGSPVTRVVSAELPPDAIDGADWSGGMYTLGDGSVTSTALLNQTGAECLYYTGGRYRESSADSWKEVTVLFGCDGSVVSVVTQDPATGAAAEISIAPGSEFQVYDQVVSPDGKTKPSPGATFAWPENGLLWEQGEAPECDYQVNVSATSPSGTVTVSSTTVTLEDAPTAPEPTAEPPPTCACDTDYSCTPGCECDPQCWVCGGVWIDDLDPNNPPASATVEEVVYCTEIGANYFEWTIATTITCSDGFQLTTESGPFQGAWRPGCPPSETLCGDGICQTHENPDTCPQDCPARCGDTFCHASETCSNCPQDCGACPATCGNDVCEASETCETCPQDCGACSQTIAAFTYESIQGMIFFTDQSIGATSWLWTFSEIDGAFPASSTDPTPIVYYSICGWENGDEETTPVTLEVWGPDGYDSITENVDCGYGTLPIELGRAKAVTAGR
jgi:hypothetical protein